MGLYMAIAGEPLGLLGLPWLLFAMEYPFYLCSRAYFLRWA